MDQQQALSTALEKDEGRGTSSADERDSIMVGSSVERMAAKTDQLRDEKLGERKAANLASTTEF